MDVAVVALGAVEDAIAAFAVVETAAVAIADGATIVPVGDSRGRPMPSLVTQDGRSSLIHTSDRSRVLSASQCSERGCFAKLMHSFPP